MPFSSEGLEAGTGLALSGGGFRATLFHCGALWRLNELGLLPKLARVSSVSGGSITAGQLGLKWAAITGEYAGGLFGKATLQDLPDVPRFIFNSTNLATAVDFRFSKPYAGDYRIGLIRRPEFTVALAVAASSAFPPFLSPVVLKPDPVSFEKSEGADLYDDIAFRKTVTLTDGGVYDNLGLETVWKRLRTLLVSDAGAPFDYEGTQGSDWARQSLRVISVLTHQAWSLRTNVLVRMYKSGERDGAYWGIGTPISRYDLPDALPVPPKVTETLAKMRTRLNPFTESEQCSLINWGYAVCDAAVRKHLHPPTAPTPAWPYPAYALDGAGPKLLVTRKTADLVEPGVQP
jgi:NTE family protein